MADLFSVSMSAPTFKKQEVKKYIVEGLPERLKDSNFHALNGYKLIEDGYLIAQYANSGTMVVHQVIESFPTFETNTQPSRDSLKRAPSRVNALFFSMIF
jgi:hypothetical protein